MPGYLDDRRDTVALLGDVGDEGGPPLYDLLQGHLHFDDADVAVLERKSRGLSKSSLKNILHQHALIIFTPLLLRNTGLEYCQLARSYFALRQILCSIKCINSKAKNCTWQLQRAEQGQAILTLPSFKWSMCVASMRIPRREVRLRSRYRRTISSSLM